MIRRLEGLSLQERKALTRFRGMVLKLCAPGRCSLRLFGSRVRGEGDAESDIDVLVLPDRYDEKTKKKVWDVAYRVFADTGILTNRAVV